MSKVCAHTDGSTHARLAVCSSGPTAEEYEMLLAAEQAAMAESMGGNVDMSTLGGERACRGTGIGKMPAQDAKHLTLRDRVGFMNRGCCCHLRCVGEMHAVLPYRAGAMGRGSAAAACVAWGMHAAQLNRAGGQGKPGTLAWMHLVGIRCLPLSEGARHRQGSLSTGSFCPHVNKALGWVTSLLSAYH